MSSNIGGSDERQPAQPSSAVDYLVTQISIVRSRSLTTHTAGNRTRERLRWFSGAKRNTRDRSWRADPVSLQT